MNRVEINVLPVEMDGTFGKECYIDSAELERVAQEAAKMSSIGINPRINYTDVNGNTNYARDLYLAEYKIDD